MQRNIFSQRVPRWRAQGGVAYKEEKTVTCDNIYN
jgi:hypothetical protein